MGSNQSLDIMRRKRAVHEEVINLVQQKRITDAVPKETDLESTFSNDWEKKGLRGLKRKEASFKDDDFYISSVPANRHLEAGLSVKGSHGFSSNRLETAVLDLVADDNSAMQKQKSVYHWDKRSKKYIKLNNGERVTATGKIKTESGAKGNAEKSGMYKKWKERSHKKISLGGSATDASGHDTGHAGKYQARGNKSNFRGRNNRQSLPNANVKSELRDTEQVRKNRQQKASKIARFNSKSTKGNKKFGNKKMFGNKKKKF